MNEPEEYRPEPRGGGDEGFFSNDKQVAPPQANGKWESAPTIIKLALILDGVFILYGVLLFLYAGTVMMDGAIVPSIIQSTMAALYILTGAWTLNEVRWGSKGAHGAQIGVATLALCMFPLGTALGIVVFAQWSKPEVKAWFGIEIQ